jgi:hypothetical protein
MARYSITMGADASLTYVCDVHKVREHNDWQATAFVYGTFGSGTVTLHVSPDGGTTKVPLLNTAGTAISIATAGAMVRTQLAGNESFNGQAMKIYATLSGSTAPALNVVIYDNR